MAAQSKGAPASVLKLIPVTSVPEKNYISALRALLRRAERGESVGLAYVEITNLDGYFANAVGMADGSPTFCLGAVEVLKAKLLKKVMG
ncbi:hypothetical protein SAMN05216428_1177 [Nitrosospira sp. Nsp11]|uniref:hypothetical protein n=1 Tax=Nitrosospira sp. Nsp11 TaxID=1855338 RepID=UPI000910118F|nr:hypothetical protein [Nitrosospira sp. Nsp11]SHM20104.1 hypothetical protein SAMN05216428_1177 [Nitrosospira sp. Nsp11]